MVAVIVLFVIVCLLAIGSIITQGYQRNQHKNKTVEQRRQSYQSVPRLQPRLVELSKYGTHLLEEVERKRQAVLESMNKLTISLDLLAVEEAKIRSGIEGESALDSFLFSQLDDRWTIIAGYRAHKGEIDRILVGPNGVFAFEVKSLGGVIHCNGDFWWRDKTDRRGNVIERGIPIADNGGRSPSRQINDTADTLERLLRGNGHDVRVVRVIVLAHPGASFGTIKNLTVDFLVHIRGVHVRGDMKKLFLCGTPLSSDQTRQIATTIIRHHEWFECKEKSAASLPRLLRPSTKASSPAS